MRWAPRSPLAGHLDARLLPDRAGAYASDLASLGQATTSAATVDDVDDARGLALLYLVAGSSAGARVLLRGLPAEVPADARRGLTDAAGRASTALWRETVSMLGRPTSQRFQDAVAAEALGVLHLLLDLQPVGVRAP
jgi:hypothetical protein